MGVTLAQNPFLGKYATPREVTPFDRIRMEHYEPAIREGIRQQNEEIEAVTDNPETPTFANTIEPFERSGELLQRVAGVFANLLSAETNGQMQELAQTLMPMIDDHANNIRLNRALFLRIKHVYDHRAQETLNGEQQRLLEDIYQNFARNGANLEGKDRDKFRELSRQLTLLALRFGENNLKETNDYRLVVTDEERLSGLPETLVAAAAETAREQGVEGWAFTLQAPSYVPFLRYADDRDLRRELYMAYNTKCTRDNGCCNFDVVKQLVNARMELANLLGYKDYASYRLEHRMAQDCEHVYRLLDQLLEAYAPAARQEYAEVLAFARKREGDDFRLMPWDWSYYSNALKESKFNMNDELLRPYFEIARVKEGVFGLATRLYGITFKRNTGIPVYHPDVEAYEVFDRDGSYLAVLYVDFYPRAGKRPGAWMTAYKEQWKDEATGENSRPHVSLVMNFTKPAAGTPSLLTFDELQTFLHEFGHSLHGMFANTVYRTLSGTNVYWDFVELPSLIMENFAVEKDFLRTFARHYKTGEVIPDELVQRIVDSSNFNVAYACLRQLGFSLIDMAWHTRVMPFEGDVIAYERAARKRSQVLPEADGTCMSTQFSHIFSGGYAAGYYSYKWAEVLDADAFSMFKQNGIFNPEVAASLRENILSKGGTEHPMALYRHFRGQEPTIDALLIRNEIKKE